jgi:hypothetical protein
MEKGWFVKVITIIVITDVFIKSFGNRDCLYIGSIN